MPQVVFNVNAAQGQLLLDAFAERHPDYGAADYAGDLPPGMTDLQKGKQIIIDVVRGHLHGLKRRQALASVDDSDTELG